MDNRLGLIPRHRKRLGLRSKTMVWPRFEFDGWQGHYRRTRRWLDRLYAVANKPDFPIDDQIDYALVFFQAAYHLREYLSCEDIVTKGELDELMANTPALRSCRDLCLGAKHRRIKSPSVDPTPWIVREYSPTPEAPQGWRLVVKVGELLDLVALAANCMQAWDRFLATHNLDPWSPSPLAAKIDAALRDRHGSQGV